MVQEAGLYQLTNVRARTTSLTRWLRLGFRVLSALILAGLLATALDAQTASGSQATGRILGRVVEAATGEPLAQARVAIEGGPSTLTDLNGRIMFRGIGAGPVNLTVQTLGYASKTVTDVAVPAGDVVMLDVAQESQAIEVEGSGSRRSGSGAARCTSWTSAGRRAPWWKPWDRNRSAGSRTRTRRTWPGG
mgnify:CR=1 FL=1